MRRFGDIDVQRLGLLLIAMTDLSKGGYALIRYDRELQEWRINVRWKEREQTVTARATEPKDRWPALMLAVDRALQWLAAAQADPR